LVCVASHLLTRAAWLVHAPVFMAPANCAEGNGWMLTSGDPARHQGPHAMTWPAAAARQAHQRRAVQPAVVRDVDSA
jgi:hypothetical protein